MLPDMDQHQVYETTGQPVHKFQHMLDEEEQTRTDVTFPTCFGQGESKPSRQLSRRLSRATKRSPGGNGLVMASHGFLGPMLSNTSVSIPLVRQLCWMCWEIA
jgi:hypothetical protein